LRGFADWATARLTRRRYVFRTLVIELAFGPFATQIKYAKSASAETTPKRAPTLDARFCQLTFIDQAWATLQIRLWRWLALDDALAPAKTIRNSTDS
jgi:hypothetical protein